MMIQPTRRKSAMTTSQNVEVRIRAQVSSRRPDACSPSKAAEDRDSMDGSICSSRKMREQLGGCESSRALPSRTAGGGCPHMVLVLQSFFVTVHHTCKRLVV